MRYRLRSGAPSACCAGASVVLLSRCSVSKWRAATLGGAVVRRLVGAQSSAVTDDERLRSATLGIGRDDRGREKGAGVCRSERIGRRGDGRRDKRSREALRILKSGSREAGHSSLLPPVVCVVALVRRIFAQKKPNSVHFREESLNQMSGRPVLSTAELSAVQGGIQQPRNQEVCFLLSRRHLSCSLDAEPPHPHSLPPLSLLGNAFCGRARCPSQRTAAVGAVCAGGASR